MKITKKSSTIIITTILLLALILPGNTAFAIGNQPMQFTISSASGSLGDTLEVKLSVTGNEAGFCNTTFSLAYDKEYLELVSWEILTTGESNFDSGRLDDYSAPNSNTILLMFDNFRENTYVNGEIVSYKFTIVKEPPQTANSLLPLVVREVYNLPYGEEPETESTNGYVTISATPNEPLPETIEITIAPNGGVGAVTSYTVAQGQSFTTPTSSELSRANYTLTSWNTAPSGIGGTSYAVGATINNITTPFTLYAQWTRNTTTPVPSPDSVIGPGPIIVPGW